VVKLRKTEINTGRIVNKVNNSIYGKTNAYETFDFFASVI